MYANRYQPGEQLGRGGMGAVYRTVDHLTQKEVALKQLEIDGTYLERNPAAGDSRWQRVMLAREFRFLASLRHPNIVTVLDYGFTTDQMPFFVMELLENTINIREAAKNLPTPGKVDLLIQTLQAVAYLHRHGILHRDLKPSNIMVNQDGLVKLLDFGIAIRQEDKQDVAGTIYYMAPEVIQKDKANQATDLYTIGIIAYEMFVGNRPFAGKTFAATVEQILFTMPDMSHFSWLAETDQMINGITEVVLRLLQKDLTARYQSALDVISALCHAIGDPLPPEEAVIRESFLQAAKFVGREDEINHLKAALKDAKGGYGSAWLVGGESGVGKSRLLDEMRIHALVEGALVLRGQVSENELFPTKCWQPILRPLLLAMQISREEASILKVIVPDIEMLLNQDVPTAVEVTIEQLALTIVALFQRIAQPTVLIIDDLHWANSSLEPLRLLIPLLGELPLMIIGSFRYEEAPGLGEKLPGTQLMKLDRLSDENIAELSVSMLGSNGSAPAVLDLLRKETEGNAFFMVEVVRALAEEAGHLEAIGEITLPEEIFTGGIQRIIQRRLHRVPDWAYTGLQLAALMGRRLDLRVLDKILSPILSLITGEDVSISVSTIWREKRGLHLNDWLFVCADAAIFEVQDGDWRFSHDKLREQLLYDMKEEERRTFRKQIDKAIEAIYMRG